MKKISLSVAVFMAAFLISAPVRAQFNTVVDQRSQPYEIIPALMGINHIADNKTDTINNSVSSTEVFINDFPERNTIEITSKEPLRKKHLDLFKTYEGLPGLTISNLLYEIRKNGILHEKVVLAQAILETGWFTSSVCRNKNNLFGLTNPRTGQYYEFDHWTESVKAYYTKVQYRYKGGNYLLWLDEIGYAEKKTYIQALIALLSKYFI